jgi:vacuolar-type H+-ATPase subunit E/Vma4
MGIERRIRRQEERKVINQINQAQQDFLKELLSMTQEEKDEFVAKIKKEYEEYQNQLKSWDADVKETE